VSQKSGRRKEEKMGRSRGKKKDETRTMAYFLVSEFQKPRRLYRKESEKKDWGMGRVPRKKGKGALRGGGKKSR